jgi:sulfur carrier protein ThiS
MKKKELLAFVAKIFAQETNISVFDTFDWSNGSLFIRLTNSTITMKESKKIHDFFQGYGFNQPNIAVANNSLCIELTEKIVSDIFEIYYTTLQPLIDKAQVYIIGKYSEEYIEASLYSGKHRWNMWDINNAIKKAKENLVVSN